MNTNPKGKKIIIVGSYNASIFAMGKVIPRIGETVVSDNYFVSAGGKGSNQAIAAKFQGADVYFIGKLGDDSYAGDAMMAGNMINSNHREYNIENNIPAAQKIFDEWPTPIVVSPYELGVGIRFPATAIVNNLNYATPNPLRIAYESYMKMPYDCCTWDLTSVLYAVEGTKDYFNISEWGRIVADVKGCTQFYPDENGKHAYLKVNKEKIEIIHNRFVELITTKPANK